MLAESCEEFQYDIRLQWSRPFMRWLQAIHPGTR
jgi:hypothetical protein